MDATALPDPNPVHIRFGQMTLRTSEQCPLNWLCMRNGKLV